MVRMLPQERVPQTSAEIITTLLRKLNTKEATTITNLRPPVSTTSIKTTNQTITEKRTITPTRGKVMRITFPTTISTTTETAPIIPIIKSTTTTATISTSKITASTPKITSTTPTIILSKDTGIIPKSPEEKRLEEATRIAQFRTLDPYQMVKTVGDLFPGYWGEKTISNARTVAKQLVMFAEEIDMDPWEETTVASWLKSKTLLLPATKESYTKVFLMIRKLRDATPLQVLTREMINKGSRIPTFQAPPITKEQIKQIKTTRDQQMQIWLAWKTASRWGDLTNLAPEDMVRVDQDMIIIDWGAKTKSSIRQPYRASKYTVIIGEMTKELAIWLTQRPLPWTWLKTDEVTMILKRTDPTLSAHSIKAGATAVLERAVALGQLSHSTKSILLKHNSAEMRQETGSTTSLRYGRDRAMQAISLGTQNATWLL